MTTDDQPIECFVRADNGSYILRTIAKVREHLPSLTREQIIKRLDCHVCGTPAGFQCGCQHRGHR